MTCQAVTGVDARLGAGPPAWGEAAQRTCVYTHSEITRENQLATALIQGGGGLSPLAKRGVIFVSGEAQKIRRVFEH